MKVKFDKDGFEVTYRTHNSLSDRPTSDGSEERRTEAELRKQLLAGSEFAQKHGLDDKNMEKFRKYLGENKTRIRGQEAEDIISALDDKAKEFLSARDKGDNSGKDALAAIAGATAAGVLTFHLPEITQGLDNVLKKVDKEIKMADEGKDINTLPEKLFFPQKLLKIKDRSDPKKIAEILGGEVKEDSKGQYFNILSSGKGSLSIEKIYLNDPEQLQETFRRLDAEKTAGQRMGL